MAFPAEYHIGVRRSIPASVALLSVLALPAVLGSSSSAQINGVPSSVTSPGFGGRAINGTASSVTSLGPNGFSPGPNAAFFPSFPSTGRFHDGHRHHRHHFVPYAPPLYYAVPLPYAVDIGATDDNSDDSDADYHGGPTVFDRRGSGRGSYVPPVHDVPTPHAAQSADSENAAPEDPVVPTLLVFKDGHQLEVGNYAIVGATLFDLTPGHPRKIALADLDLEATRKQNDDRGVNFQLPQGFQVD